MRTLCLYVLTLSLFLLGGYRYLYGGTADSASKFASGPRVAKAQQQFNFDRKEDGSATLHTALPTQEKQDEVRVEDDDDDITSARRNILLAKYFVTLVFASFLFFFYKDLHVRSFLSRQLYTLSSGRYILQRSLRI